MKKCIKCNDFKDLSSFNKGRNNCKICQSNYKKKWFRENKEKESEACQEHYKNNKEHILSKVKDWQDKNKGKRISYNAKYRSAKLNATLPGYDEEINLFYLEAKVLEGQDGIKRHVDHIVPLQGKTICGLHVPWNLRVITAQENLNKSNKLLNKVE